MASGPRLAHPGLLSFLGCVVARVGASGVILTRTTSVLLVATYEPPQSFADCICEVEKLADYYISMQL